MKTILVLDDEIKIRDAYTRVLKREGFDVLCASCVKDAYQTIRQKEVDLILLDIKMPLHDGSDLYCIIHLFFKKIKVLVSSVYPVDEQKNIIIGAAGYFDKSHGVDVLIQKVNNILKEETYEKDTYCR